MLFPSITLICSSVAWPHFTSSDCLVLKLHLNFPQLGCLGIWDLGVGMIMAVATGGIQLMNIGASAWGHFSLWLGKPFGGVSCFSV